MGCLKLTNYKKSCIGNGLLQLNSSIKDYTLIEESTASNEVLKEFVWDPTAGQATKPLYMRVPQTGSNLLYLHDANKNVTEVSYLATANGIGAHYEYDSFGNVITSSSNTRVSSPDLRTYNPFRFSSEYHDDELSLIYYNYRHYNPQTGRWISRDPIEEIGGNNLYGMCKNNLLNHIDLLGEDAIAIGVGGTIGTLVCPGAGTLIGITVGVLIVAGVTTYLYIAECKTETTDVVIPITKCSDKPTGCKPCIPPVGSISYRTDFTGKPHNGVPTPHSHKYRMNQIPYPDCTCKWNKLRGDPEPGEKLPKTPKLQDGVPLIIIPHLL